MQSDFLWFDVRFVDYGLSNYRLLLDVYGGIQFGQSSHKISQEMLKGWNTLILMLMSSGSPQTSMGGKKELIVPLAQIWGL